jgi:NADH:ubiquinone oxidoreductase subunit 3 (subunit A)
MEKLLITPPSAFLLVLFACWALGLLFSRLAYKVEKKSDGSGKPYACGEDNYDPMAQPDYSNAFPFAFFFTLAHIAALIMTTVPTETRDTFVIAAIYILGAIIGLVILFRR